MSLRVGAFWPARGPKANPPYAIALSGNPAYRLGLAWNGNTTFVGDNALSLTGLAFDTAFANLYSRNNNVPEPGVLALVSLGLLGVAASRRNKA